MTPGTAELSQRGETVRRANLSAVVRLLHQGGPRSRSDLVAQTGLTRSAIRSLVGELGASGLVSEVRPPARRRPGRPSPLVGLVPSSAVAVAFSIDANSLAAAVVGLGGVVLGKARAPRPPGHRSADAVVDDLAALLGELPADVPDPGAVVSLGVGVAGVVRSRDGRVEMAPNLGWRQVPLGELIASRLGWGVPVTVRNWSDLGALAEHRRGSAVATDDLLYVHGEVGVGGGIIMGGSPVGGAAGYGGEIGHFPIVSDGLPCHCGSTGCWETEVGARALLSRAGLPADGGTGALDSLFAAAAAGDAVALAAIDATGRRLGMGLGGLVNLLNPRLIVLGGLFARLHPIAREAIGDELARHSLPAPRAMVRVVPASLGADAPLLGAAEVGLEPILADPTARYGARAAHARRATAS